MHEYSFWVFLITYGELLQRQLFANSCLIFNRCIISVVLRVLLFLYLGLFSNLISRQVNFDAYA